MGRGVVGVGQHRLGTKTIEELGKKTGAWTTTIAWDPAVFTTENLKQYDAIFLSSTTGCFLDKAGDKATTDARRAAFTEFVPSLTSIQAGSICQMRSPGDGIAASYPMRCRFSRR